MTRLSVIGTGYLGTTHAACMASLGHQVIAYDLDSSKIEQLARGHIPFFEPDLSDLVATGLKSGNLKFSTDLEIAVKSSEVHFLCVGTPQSEESGSADLSQIKLAAAELAKVLQPGSVIVGKSTVPVGTAKWISRYLQENSNQEFNLVWNPEFLREGFAVKDTLSPDRIVLGFEDPGSALKVEQIYEKAISLGTPVIRTDFATAELVKVAANAFLATKISFINAFADLCDATGADVSTLADAIGYDSRIGRKFLNAGIGFGGGCLPKDIRALQARANELGLQQQFEFLSEVDQINLARRNKVVDLTESKLGNLEGRRIAILGAAFKPNSDDVRDSPAVGIARMLIAKGADVVVHDPVALPALNKKDSSINTEQNLELAIKGAEIVLHLTEWDEYQNLDPSRLSEIVKKPKIIDGRNILNRAIWENSGWQITYLGKPSS